MKGAGTSDELCSDKDERIRHFLINQWILPITLIVNRDWTWDGTAPTSFEIFRKRKMVGAGLTEEERDAIPWGTEELVATLK